MVTRQWRRGQPPKDGAKYEARLRLRIGGGWSIPEWPACPVWWDGETFVTTNQFSGGTYAFVPAPNEWRLASGQPTKSRL